jgi:hypothetical protein
VNAVTGAVIAALVALSMILTVSVLFPDWANERTIVGILAGAAAVAAVAFALAAFRPRRTEDADSARPTAFERDAWRMPPLHKLPPAKLSVAARIWMAALRLYLIVAGGLVLVRIVSLAIGTG